MIPLFLTIAGYLLFLYSILTTKDLVGPVFKTFMSLFGLGLAFIIGVLAQGFSMSALNADMERSNTPDETMQAILVDGHYTFDEEEADGDHNEGVIMVHRDNQYEIIDIDASEQVISDCDKPGEVKTFNSYSANALLLIPGIPWKTEYTVCVPN